uniref:Chemosensory protein 11 n=2 Tax=Dendrolimus TaxID=151303 RepID=A0A2K8GL08_9NEOP|nr:Chemosensory protein 11 [Dendrolimus punctatus]
MKIFLLLCLLAVGYSHATETYTTENDDLDIDRLVNNNDEFLSFIRCFLDMQECNSVAADFKKDLPEAVQTACLKCTQAQKHIFNKFLAGLKEKLPKEYEEFSNKFDPQGIYFGPLEKAVASS